MKSIDDIVREVADAGGSVTFSPESCGISHMDFQAVVDLIRDAEARGFIRIHREHPSGREVGIDHVVVLAASS